MSNFHREWLPCYGADDPGPTILIGAEDVAGTGQVELSITDAWGDHADLVMPWRDALAFGEMLAEKAREAGRNEV